MKQTDTRSCPQDLDDHRHFRLFLDTQKKLCTKIEENVETLKKRILINDGVWPKMSCLKV